MKQLVISLSLLLLASAQGVSAMPAVLADTVAADSCSAAPVKKSFFRKVYDYFSLDGGSSTPSTSTFSVLGGPYYESVSGLAISLVGAASFRLNGCDTTTQLSNAQLSGTYTTNNFWSLNFSSNILFPNESRLITKMAFEYQPSYYWGMGYDNGNIDANKMMQKKYVASIEAELLFAITGDFRMGPKVQWDYVKSDTIAKPELLEGQDRVLRNYGVGFAAEYDTRDMITDAKTGCYLYLGQTFRPKFLWNHYAFSTTDIKASYYRPLWRDCTLAADFSAMFNFGNPSWAKMAQIGDTHRMRGYYQGRYRDKHMLTAQVEFRQHIWRRNGIVVWLGCGNVFHDAKSFKHILPNYGIGYRFAFRRRMNIRLDYGFGKSGQTGFMFSLNEAF
ncbi:MAG: BamA/TamA family outer membrane protein [Bacteroidales bacterium]|nr:BamA/TamA family outer membrane protein [Bacteroidales bacterium]